MSDRITFTDDEHRQHCKRAGCKHPAVYEHIGQGWCARCRAVVSVDAGDWTWGNDTAYSNPMRTIFFIYRRLSTGDAEYLWDKRGQLRTWRSQKAVKAALEKLNGY